MRFIVTELSPPDEGGSWKELYKVLVDMLVAIFWLTPKAIIREVFGKDGHEDHHDEPIDDSPGWHSMGQDWPNGLERLYFEAETTFNDIRWHAVDGYQFRINESFPELEDLYFEGKSIYPFEVGFIGQALAVDGNTRDCPIVFINIQKKTVERLLDLEGVALVGFLQQKLTVRMPHKRWVISIN